jgi:cell division protein FtsB
MVAPASYILLAGILAVFAHSALQGEHGLAALHEAEALEHELRSELELTGAERAEMQNLVRRLDERYLDLDLLDERARAVLGLVRPEDVVIR